jgi:hypothetical protein
MTEAGKTSATMTAKPASDSAAAIQARVRATVLVTKASGSPASRNRRKRRGRPLKRLPRHDQDGQPRLRNKLRKLRPLPSRTRATKIT